MIGVGQNIYGIKIQIEQFIPYFVSLSLIFYLILEDHVIYHFGLLRTWSNSQYSSELTSTCEAHCTEAFSKTSQLQFLSLCDMQLSLGLSSLLSPLKVLHWKRCPLKILPARNQVDEVVIIKLSQGKIEQPWQGRKVGHFHQELYSILSQYLKAN